MKKTVYKIFISFILIAVTIAMILLAINFLAFAILGSDPNNLYTESPRIILDNVSEIMIKTKTGFALTDEIILPNDTWFILISETGEVVWDLNKPDDVPLHYSINDIAVMTRWYLNDYPVYVRTTDYGLLVLGYPKDSMAKYSIEYSNDWFRSLPKNILALLFFNICLATVLACTFGIRLYKRLKIVTSGIQFLKMESPVHLKEKGIFREIAKSINETSNTIERKNQLIAQKDHARQNWIAGISHDIRTPLSMIMGYAEEMEENIELSGNNRNKAGIIKNQSLKMKKLLEDLNLISSLAYDMQPSKKKSIKICAILRNVISDLLNSGISDMFEIELDLQYEKAVIPGDEALMERAFFNLIHNSIMHNKDGCSIKITEGKANGVIFIEIADNGKGVADEVLLHLSEIPKSTHGLGLPMAYKIVTVHGGSFSARSENGFYIRIEFPISG